MVAKMSLLVLTCGGQYVKQLRMILGVSAAVEESVLEERPTLRVLFCLNEDFNKTLQQT